MLRTFRAALAVISLAAMAGPAAAGGLITWRVENPFRLFLDSKSTDLHRKVFEALTPEERKTPVLSVEHRLAERYPGGWARLLVGKTCWREKDNRYGPCSDGVDYINPRSHAVVLNLAGGGPATGSCRWTVTPQGGTDRNPRRTIAPCTDAVTVDVPYPDGASVELLAGQATDTAVIRVRDVFIVGLGDSFASGEGNPDMPVEFSREREIAYGKTPGGNDLAGYPARLGAWDLIGDKRFLDYDARWLSRPCHRSLYGHQLRAALQLALEDEHRAVTFAGFACAGADIAFGLLLHYKGLEWSSHPPDRPQVGEAAIAQCDNVIPPEEKYPVAFSINGKLPELADIPLARCPPEKSRPIDLLMLSVGGNDIGFSSLVANAVLASGSTLRKLGGWMGTVTGIKDAEAKLPSLELRYKALNRAIHANLHIPWSQSDRVLLTSYPAMATGNDGRRICASGPDGMTVFPEFTLNSGKAADGEELAARLTQVQRKAARDQGWSFSDAARAGFAGHGICAGDSAGRMGPADDLRFPRKVYGTWEPFNPAEYQPYASRKRWFRTPNDAFLTGNFHTSISLLKKVLQFEKAQWFQVVLASTYSGAFHPTAEGQAAIADALLPQARAILDKYAGAARLPARHGR